MEMLNKKTAKYKLILSEIYNFCKVRETKDTQYTYTGSNRYYFILEILDKYNIPYTISETKTPNGLFLKNIYMLGNRCKGTAVTAHYDIVNIDSDNFNDNSASVINAIALKVLMKNSVSVCLLDNEEFGFGGAKLLVDDIKSKFIKTKIKKIINLELTGIGGDSFFVGLNRVSNKLPNLIEEFYKCPKVNTPPHDGVLFDRNNIETLLVNTLPKIDNSDELDYQLLYLCHSMEDSIDNLKFDDMVIFTKKILTNIVKMIKKYEI